MWVINVTGKSICAYSEADPKNIPWKDIDVDYVIESSGKFKSAKAGLVGSLIIFKMHGKCCGRFEL